MSRSMLIRSLPALLFALVLAACSDELDGPEVTSCDERLEIVVQEPATVEYSVRAQLALVESVTFTTPVGDSTVASFPDQDPNDFRFDREAKFADATDARLQAVGEVATGGEIAITYSIIPDEPTAPVVTGPISVCQA